MINDSDFQVIGDKNKYGSIAEQFPILDKSILVSYNRPSAPICMLDRLILPVSPKKMQMFNSAVLILLYQESRYII
jgi:hypothetical protein